ncbi:MAG TPA: FAD-dependent monooxygenase, partial [Kofleriaceae bacterium]|nr:FAD-dependent monooxygenase [Kofleriaceae bacterium]
MHDAIVVGARCAGAPTAMLLARRGYRVLLVDRAALASDIPHGHFIHRHGPRRLHAWGLLDRITASGCPAISETTLDVGAGPLTGVGLVAGGVALGYGPRRSALDRILVEAAVEAGADLAMEFSVDELVGEGERVVGIRGRDRQGGSRVTELAAVVIGADGRNSLLARTVRAPEYEVTPPLTCWFFSYWS